jgi:hypothetical protein
LSKTATPANRASCLENGCLAANNGLAEYRFPSQSQNQTEMAKMTPFPMKLKATHSRIERVANQSKSAGVMTAQSTWAD